MKYYCLRLNNVTMMIVVGNLLEPKVDSQILRIGIIVSVACRFGFGSKFDCRCDHPKTSDTRSVAVVVYLPS